MHLIGSYMITDDLPHDRLGDVPDTPVPVSQKPYTSVTTVNKLKPFEIQQHDFLEGDPEKQYA